MATKRTTPPTPAPKLAPAAESADVDVQNLLAERQQATMTGDKAKTADIDKQLAKLGYKVD